MFASEVMMDSNNVGRRRWAPGSVSNTKLSQQAHRDLSTTHAHSHQQVYLSVLLVPGHRLTPPQNSKVTHRTAAYPPFTETLECQHCISCHSQSHGMTLSAPTVLASIGALWLKLVGEKEGELSTLVYYNPGTVDT